MQKQEKIVQMFNQIAPTYDLANRVLSLGIDVSWRKFACRYMLEIFRGKNINVIDVACGTGDMMGIWSAFPFGLTVAGVLYWLCFRRTLRKEVCLI